MKVKLTPKETEELYDFALAEGTEYGEYILGLIDLERYNYAMSEFFKKSIHKELIKEYKNFKKNERNIF